MINHHDQQPRGEVGGGGGAGITDVGPGNLFFPGSEREKKSIGQCRERRRNGHVCSCQRLSGVCVLANSSITGCHPSRSSEVKKAPGRMAWPGLAALALFPFFDSSSGLVKYPSVFSFCLLLLLPKKKKKKKRKQQLNSTAPLFLVVVVVRRKIYDGQFRQSSVAADKKKRNKRSQ